VLKAIEETVDALAKLQNEYEEITVLINALDVSGKEMLDPDGEAADTFESSENILKEFLGLIERCHKSALNDPELRGDHEENIAMEFERTIHCVQILIGVIQDKRWEIMEHDADHDELIGPFKSTKDLIADLNR